MLGNIKRDRPNSSIPPHVPLSSDSSMQQRYTQTVDMQYWYNRGFEKQFSLVGCGSGRPGSEERARVTFQTVSFWSAVSVQFGTI